MAPSPVKDDVRLTADEILISSATEDDLYALAEGYYLTTRQDWFDRMEPASKAGDLPMTTRIERFAKRMKPWLSSPDFKCMKATLREDDEATGFKAGKIVGHAGWLVPREDRHVFHHWRKDATRELGWQEKMGWTDEEVEEMWAHCSEEWDPYVSNLDKIRKETMNGEAHWFLAPLWVLPEYQGRGVSTLLLKDVFDLADATDPPTAVYLESSPDGRRVYEHFNFEKVPEVTATTVMIRRGPRRTTRLKE